MILQANPNPVKAKIMRINVNGTQYDVPDDSFINMKDNVLYVNGTEHMGSGYDNREFKIEITGGLASLVSPTGQITVNGDCGRVSGGSITVKGNVNGDVDARTGVTCAFVSGSVNAGTGVICGDIGGDVKAGTGITCGNIKGNAKAGTGITKKS